MIFPKIRTILFTEECQLSCNYCNLKTFSDYATCQNFSSERIWKEVKRAKEDGCNALLFTGGEPLLYFNLIKEIMETYKGDFAYHFNTNGQYLTFDVCQFLSRYSVVLNLSIDGPREIAMWRRPNSHNNNFSYWDEFEKNIPHILYFFPNVTWKSIISKRLIPYMSFIYTAAANYGFKTIDFEFDFNEQPWRSTSDESNQWSDEDWENYNLQMNIITSVMTNLIESGSFPTVEIRTFKYLNFILREQDKEVPKFDNIMCGISSGRDLTTMYSGTKVDICLQEIMQTQGWTTKQLIEEIEKDFNEGCANDKNCVLKNFCARYGCIKDNFTATGQFSTSPKEYCLQNLIARKQAMDLLTFGIENFQGNEAYGNFLAQFQGGCDIL